MKPANKAARLAMNKAKDSAKPERKKTDKRRPIKYEVFNDEGISLGFLTVHGKVKG